MKQRVKALDKLKKAAGTLHIAHWLVIFLSLCLTLFAWWYSKEQVFSKITIQFNKQADQVVRLVIDRMQKYEDALWGGVSFFHAMNDTVSYADWKSYVDSLNIVNKYPGINGMGVIYSLKPNKLTAFLQEQQRTRPHFKIHPIHQKNRFLPITYIIPVKGNEKAVGLDMAFEKNRFTAALKAEETGKAQLTRPIILVQDQQKTPGFLLFAPIYSKKGLSNKQERKTHFLGMVYAPFIMKKLMHGTLAEENRDIAIKITDKHMVLFDEMKQDKDIFDKNTAYKKTVDIQLYGQTWTFHLWGSSSFVKATSSNQPYAILIAGIIIDLLLIILFIQMAGSRQRAVNYAKSLNKDIHQQAKKHATLNKRLELALSASQVGVWEYDIQTKTLIWDEAMFALYGVNKNDFTAVYEIWEKALHPEDKEAVLSMLELTISKMKKFDTSFRILLPDQSIRVIRALADAVYEKGIVKKIIGVNWDITDIKDNEAQLKYMAQYDALSQLKNRFSFNESCSKFISHAEKNNNKFALLLIDIDDFKQVNDLYGHQVGDKFISLLSESLKNTCRNRDAVFRLGGDEFAMLTDYFEDSEVVEAIAERIVSALHAPFHIEGNKIQSSCSIGVAVFPHAGRNEDELIMNADIALYKSKQEGKDCISFFTDALNEKSKRHRFIKNNLLTAIDSNEILMNYQPIVDLKTKKIFAYEALARWNSSIGHVPAEEFISVAEKTNTIKQLGEEIIKQVAHDIAQQNQALIVSINCSSKQLINNAGFSDFLFETLERCQIPPETVILEITESVLIRDYKGIRKTLENINQKGVDIAIDDFGTGYSSLSLLANIPFQYLKIDREFINNMHTPAGFKILQSIYNVAQSLNKNIIAEGVETQEQRDALFKMGVHLVQGYYFSKPVDIHQIPTAKYEKLLDMKLKNRIN